jgi:glucosylceramidase
VPGRRRRRDANVTLGQLYKGNGTGAQQWQPRSDGTLHNPQRGRCLDASSASSANGTRLIIWDYHGGPTQRCQPP